VTRCEEGTVEGWLWVINVPSPKTPHRIQAILSAEAMPTYAVRPILSSRDLERAMRQQLLCRAVIGGRNTLQIRDLELVQVHAFVLQVPACSPYCH
jgi:hypothetical protein